MIVCYMGVEQTLSELKMHLMTPEYCILFYREPYVDALHRCAKRLISAIFVYTNEPNIHLRDERTSLIHKGALIINTHGSGVRPDILTAEYWTDRDTVGTMDFNSRVDEVFTRLCRRGVAFYEQS